MYSVHPDMQAGSGCATGCGTGTTFGNYTSVSSHQLVDVVTDPSVGLATVIGPPPAWYDQTNGEIGDICNAQQSSLVGADGQTYTVQKYWSNAQNACVAGTPANNFSISASPSSVSLAQGASGASAISTAITSGTAERLSLTVSGLPAGATARVNRRSVRTGGSATLTIKAGTASVGTYPDGDDVTVWAR
jgi:hypothetical protein